MSTILLALPQMIKADDNWKGAAIFDAATIPAVKSPQVSFGIGLKGTYTLNDYLGAGFGIGLTESWKFNSSPSVPIYLTAHAEDFSKDFTPTFDFDMGVSCSENSSFFINPVIGVRYEQFGIGVGYLGAQAFKKGFGWGSNFNVRLAYYFGYHKTSQFKAFGCFLSQIQVGVELFSAFSLSSPKEGVRCAPRLAYGLNLAFLYPIAKNIEFGPVVGFAVQQYKENTDDYWNNDPSEVYVPLSIRTKYRIREFSFGPIHPFAQIDLGTKITISDSNPMKSSFLWSPSIGVSLDLREGRSSVDLGVCYQDVKIATNAHNSDSKSKTYGQIGVSIGYTF